MIDPGERVFDRRPKWDRRNEGFRMLAVADLVEKPLRSYTWSVSQTLDQGSEGACVGFAFAHELIARPRIVSVDDVTARGIYYDARKVDEYVGEDYEGTSVLAGAKVLVGRGHFTEYRWARDVNELALAVGYSGPAVLGIDWHTGMDNPVGPDPWIYAEGPVRGGHAILCYSVNVKGRFFRLHNSWGPTWGDGGNARISFDHVQKLLDEFGEACIPMGRQRVREA